MAAAADGPRLPSLIAVLLITARETLQRPEQLHTAASSLQPLLLVSCRRRSAGRGCWICGWCYRAEGTVSTRPFPSVLPLGRAPGIALVLLLALVLVRLRTQSCPGTCCAASSSSAKAFTGVGPRKLYPDGSRNPLLPLPFQFPMLRLH